jgi:hypothetical protein
MMLQAWEWCRIDGVAGLGMVPVWSMASPAWGRGRWWCVRRPRPGSGMMVQRLRGGLYDRAGSDLGRSTTTRGLGKFSVGNFGILSA